MQKLYTTNLYANPAKYSLQIREAIKSRFTETVGKGGGLVVPTWYVKSVKNGQKQCSVDVNGVRK